MLPVWLQASNAVVRVTSSPVINADSVETPGSLDLHSPQWLAGSSRNRLGWILVE